MASRSRHLMVLFAVLAIEAMVGGVLASPLETAASLWLKKAAAAAAQYRPRESGCWRQPWVCNEEGGRGRFLPFGMRQRACCNNRCVDVNADVNHCGACGVRCPFSWTCCNGVCIDPKTNPLHCGACNNQCASGSVCSHGMCGYASQPQLPMPPPFQPYPFPRQPCKHSPPHQPPPNY